MQKIMFNDKCFLTDLTLEGIKRMTRRPIKVKNIIVRDCDPIFNPADAYYKGHSGYYLLIDGDTGKVIRPRYKVGEIVAVAQSYDRRLEEQNVRPSRPYAAPDKDYRNPCGEASGYFRR